MKILIIYSRIYLITKLSLKQIALTFKVVYNGELVGEYNLLAANSVDKVNIFTRLIKGLNYLIWGDV